ncbi:hypothetical protein A3C89_04210 [Candidatus Kaiserbacteria bacterium RIFCSPHIGHO2_02_FULL_50_50]|uniref:Pseudouridine synthase RsuA/RluA-like domain-containing protein n=1 Tax=Candidatus Kaiserbacteria bacterium RIFCSPHIGHO2_02_FULL_50_50 TaxID=1798492 RepID=A0A1F6DGN0_9BACT|nr:MAG: hypothetical protein A3C89_04210 [Candidatus Kaiserbacteria bacterium RIFCSPHIGHO2_02_FULL_50_50]OGG88634.1 MAG: hypothetical protein A3G62_00885 [Candidatus Kaiserbacteria bacterium RIFCSPLOWO2_12_FULL_50_10]
MQTIEILEEDDNVLVINKPSGLLVHEEKQGSAEPTVVAWFLTTYPEARGVGEPQYDMQGNLIERSGVVHRLDKGTSGVLILAKTQEAYNHLKSQFHDRLAQKEYQAIVYGYFKAIKGRIEAKIGRAKSDPRKRSAFKNAVGTLRDAVTDWELITQNAQFAHIRLMPKTGRTHQLRAHLTFLSHPIVGDGLYATKEQFRSTQEVSRILLHAHSLTITLLNGEQKKFTAPLPGDFTHFIHKKITPA